MIVKSISYFFANYLSRVDEYQLASGLFIKLLALIYFAAFYSLSVQITGLVGENGILPVSSYLDFIYQKNGVIAWLYRPTLFWFVTGDYALKGAAVLGTIVSLLLIGGFKPVWSLIVLFVLYLSLVHAGQTFLSFQWDVLLLETGFLTIFLTNGPTRLLLFLFHWLLFRLRFMSGMSKLASGDPSWWNLTTLNYYFETQPLPHVGAWYFHQLPEWILQGGVLLVFFTELIVPFFIFLPRKFRLFAAGSTILLQLIIIATSNHNWINLLTIMLCLFLLDDTIVKKIVPQKLGAILSINEKVEKQAGICKRRCVLPVVALVIVVSSTTSFTGMVTNINIPEVLVRSASLASSWGIGHMFHVFPTMQTERHELEIEGSYNGKEWRRYIFKYKPGPLDKTPEFIVPHQPRLDWMIWFVPPQHAEMMYWFEGFINQLQQGSTEVNDLLEYNPFPDSPPVFLRVLVYQYHFTTSDERKITGNWWKREYMGEFPYVRRRIP